MASERILEEKKKIVSEITDKIQNSESVILFQYQGLTVRELTDLRNKLREVNRLDLEQLEFHTLVREGFLIIQEREPERVKKVNANQTIDEVFNDAYALITKAIKEKHEN